MTLAYVNKESKEVHYPVHVHNFSPLNKEQVRIIGNISLNPKDKTYPDKKWISKDELYSVPSNIKSLFIIITFAKLGYLDEPNFSEKFIKNYTY